MTYEEFVAQCLDNADETFVRAEIDGKWQSVALSALTGEEAMEHVNRWWKERQ